MDSNKMTLISNMSVMEGCYHLNSSEIITDNWNLDFIEGILVPIIGSFGVSGEDSFEL